MAKPTITIEFTEDVKVLDHNKDIEFQARAGEVRELVAPSARFWLTRDKARVIQGKPAPAAKAPAQPKATSGAAVSKPTLTTTEPKTETKAAPKKKRSPRKKSAN